MPRRSARGQNDDRFVYTAGAPPRGFLVVLGSPGSPILKSRHAKKRAGWHRPASVRWNVELKWRRCGSHRATDDADGSRSRTCRRCYWETTVINHRTGVEELSSRTDRT